jgi:Pyruvate phosphate dikinase, AMP/ATP-binding domain/PEP-utilising enzyme, mobile domain
MTAASENAEGIKQEVAELERRLYTNLTFPDRKFYLHQVKYDSKDNPAYVYMDEVEGEPYHPIGPSAYIVDELRDSGVAVAVYRTVRDTATPDRHGKILEESVYFTVAADLVDRVMAHIRSRELRLLLFKDPVNHYMADGVRELELIRLKRKLRSLQGEGEETDTGRERFADYVHRNTRILGKKGLESEMGNKERGFLLLEDLSLPYPPGIVISEKLVQICRDAESTRDTLLSILVEALKEIGLGPGDRVAVRSNPRQSMPGMFETFQTRVSPKLIRAITAVADGWYSNKAFLKRKEKGIPHTYELPVIIQKWVTGVFHEDGTVYGQARAVENLPLYAAGAFSTRNPNTNENVLYGRYIENAEGERLMTGGEAGEEINNLEKLAPEAYNALLDAKKVLEEKTHYPQEVEFVIHHGDVYFLQRRNVNFSPQGEVAYMKEQSRTESTKAKISIPLLISLTERMKGRTLYRVRSGADIENLGKGVDSTEGAMQGRLAFGLNDAEQFLRRGEPVIFVSTSETREEIIDNIFDQPNVGLITTFGNGSSHEAVTTRGAGIPAIINVEGVRIHARERHFALGDQVFRAGDFIGVDGHNNILFTAAENVLEEDTIVQDVSYGIRMSDFRQEIANRYLHEDGRFKASVTYDKLVELNSEKFQQWQDAEAANDPRGAFIASLEKHFLHDLLTRKRVEDGIP